MTISRFDRGVGCQILYRSVLAVLTATLLCAAGSAASAQTRAGMTRPDQAPAADRRAAPARPQAAPSSEDAGVANDEEVDTTQTVTVRGAQPARRPAPGNGPATGNGAPDDDPSIDPDVGDGAQRLAGRRPADGDLVTAEPPAPVDGVIPVEQPPIEVDGHLALADEMALDDPELDEVLREQERLGRPLTARRYGPYQPVGLRVGSFILFPVLDAGLSTSNNVFRSATNRKSDMFADVVPGATLTSNWNRHALEFRLQGTRTFHSQYQTEDDNRLEALARGRLDISRRTNILGELSYSYGQESRGGVNTPTTAAGERPSVVARRAGVEANHRINRLNLQLRGAVTDNVYGTVSTTDPVAGLDQTPTGNDRNYRQNEIGARAGWQFSPNLVLFAATILNMRHHEAAGADGIVRNSEGYRAQLGATIDVRGKLQGEVSAGYASQTPDDSRLKTVSGFIYNGRLTWQPTGLTEVIAEARSDIGETTTVGSGGALTRSVNLEIRHALRRHLILIAGASYSVASFGGSNARESSLTERLGLEYYLSREMALVAGLQHTHFETTAAGSRGYQDTTVRMGVRLRK